MLDYFWEIFIKFCIITVIKFLLVEHWSDYHYHLYHKISPPPVNIHGSLDAGRSKARFGAKSVDLVALFVANKYRPAAADPNMNMTSPLFLLLKTW